MNSNTQRKIEEWLNKGYHFTGIYKLEETVQLYRGIKETKCLVASFCNEYNLRQDVPISENEREEVESLIKNYTKDVK